MDSYDMTDVAAPRITFSLFEETLAVYCDYNYFGNEIDVLLDHNEDLRRDLESAIRLDCLDVW